MDQQMLLQFRPMARLPPDLDISLGMAFAPDAASLLARTAPAPSDVQFHLWSVARLALSLIPLLAGVHWLPVRPALEPVDEQDQLPAFVARHPAELGLRL